MKKILVIIGLVAILGIGLFVLTLCENKDDDNDAGNPPIQQQNSENNDNQGGSTTNIPNNGTPPTVTPPMESHSGDKAYFYVTTDDYIVTMNDYVVTKIIGYDTGEDVKKYSVISFENDLNVKSFNKYVFVDSNKAKAFVDGQISQMIFQIVKYIQIDNVVYEGSSENVKVSKEFVLHGVSSSLTYYVSKP